VCVCVCARVIARVRVLTKVSEKEIRCTSLRSENHCNTSDFPLSKHIQPFMGPHSSLP